MSAVSAISNTMSIPSDSSSSSSSAKTTTTSKTWTETYETPIAIINVTRSKTTVITVTTTITPKEEELTKLALLPSEQEKLIETTLEQVDKIMANTICKEDEPTISTSCSSESGPESTTYTWAYYNPPDDENDEDSDIVSSSNSSDFDDTDLPTTSPSATSVSFTGIESNGNTAKHFERRPSPGDWGSPSPSVLLDDILNDDWGNSEPSRAATDCVDNSYSEGQQTTDKQQTDNDVIDDSNKDNMTDSTTQSQSESFQRFSAVDQIKRLNEELDARLQDFQVIANRSLTKDRDSDKTMFIRSLLSDTDSRESTDDENETGRRVLPPSILKKGTTPESSSIERTTSVVSTSGGSSQLNEETASISTTSTSTKRVSFSIPVSSCERFMEEPDLVPIESSSSHSSVDSFTEGCYVGDVIEDIDSPPFAETTAEEEKKECDNFINEYFSNYFIQKQNDAYERNCENEVSNFQGTAEVTDVSASEQESVSKNTVEIMTSQLSNDNLEPEAAIKSQKETRNIEVSTKKEIFGGFGCDLFRKKPRRQSSLTAKRYSVISSFVPVTKHDATPSVNHASPKTAIKIANEGEEKDENKILIDLDELIHGSPVKNVQEPVQELALEPADEPTQGDVGSNDDLNSVLPGTNEACEKEFVDNESDDGTTANDNVETEVTIESPINKDMKRHEKSEVDELTIDTSIKPDVTEQVTEQDLSYCISYVLRLKKAVTNSILTEEQAEAMMNLPKTIMQLIVYHFEVCDNNSDPIDWDSLLKLVEAFDDDRKKQNSDENHGIIESPSQKSPSYKDDKESKPIIQVQPKPNSPLAKRRCWV